MKLILLSALSLTSLFAFGAEVDYTQCLRPLMIEMNAEGKVQAAKGYKMNNFDTESNPQKFVMATGLKGREDVYELHVEDDKIVRIEKYTQYASTPVRDEMVSYKLEFDNETTCQIGSIVKTRTVEDKELNQLSYDRNFCSDIMALASKYNTSVPLGECVRDEKKEPCAKLAVSMHKELKAAYNKHFNSFSSADARTFPMEGLGVIASLDTDSFEPYKLTSWRKGDLRNIQQKAWDFQRTCEDHYKPRPVAINNSPLPKTDSAVNSK